VHGGRAAAFVDLQNDVTTKDIELARLEGYGASEHVKRYTTLGMGTDQGKTANVTALGVLSELTGAPIPALGTTGFRPPYTPVTWGALAGHHRGTDFRPKRLPPSHAWAEENGAVFADAGLWLRAQWYERPGETLQQSIAREAAAVRRSVGVCDVSTLGKIDIQGPDAATLLDRVYVNKFSTLKVGRARYGLMLREDGFAMDDGTTARLGEQHFVMTTTTANAGKVMQHLEFCRQVLWPELDVRLVSVSDMRSPVRARATCWPSSSMRRSISPTKASPAWALVSSLFAAACRRGCSASRSQARWLMRSPCLRATATPRSARSCRPAPNSTSRPTAPRR
jgi:sarcosine oxidase subunit alpha